MCRYANAMVYGANEATLSAAKNYVCEESATDTPEAASFLVGPDAGDSGKLAKEELNLLAKLIGSNPDGVTSGKDTFKLHLFDNQLEGG